MLIDNYGCLVQRKKESCCRDKDIVEKLKSSDNALRKSGMVLKCSFLSSLCYVEKLHGVDTRTSENSVGHDMKYCGPNLGMIGMAFRSLK